ncbi:hypothetical protein [Nocardiopsis xinjiangensis]|uniref:hypothetical protein n=1 Tax=Nocardiopsis xinjiangensis TaxID=124285 RepID=UPI00037CA79A|nr:hypothetical protein [Nocardiopsis xinjiangensis]
MVGKATTPVHYYLIHLKGRPIAALLTQGERNAKFLAIMEATDLETRLSASETWGKRLVKDAEQGLTPMESIQRWRGVASEASVGGIPAEAELHTCTDLVELDQLLNPELEPVEDDLTRLLQDPEHLYGRDWGPLIMEKVETGYRIVAQSEITYLPVRLGGTVIGYLWASDNENARWYIPRPAAGPPAWRAERWWMRQAVDAAGRDLSPTQALRERIGLPEDPVGGRIDPADQERTAPSPDTLERIAQGTL